MSYICLLCYMNGLKENRLSNFTINLDGQLSTLVLSMTECSLAGILNSSD